MWTTAALLPATNLTSLTETMRLHSHDRMEGALRNGPYGLMGMTINPWTGFPLYRKFRRRWHPPYWGPLWWTCRAAAGCGWALEPVRWDWGSAAARGSGTEERRCSASGEVWWEAARRVEDGTVQEAWGASEHLEGGRQTGCLVQRCLENWADLQERQ